VRRRLPRGKQSSVRVRPGGRAGPRTGFEWIAIRGRIPRRESEVSFRCFVSSAITRPASRSAHTPPITTFEGSTFRYTIAASARSIAPTIAPITVRFFNWFAPEWPEPLQLQHNPDVAIRPAGVMEKCTFCGSASSAASGTRRLRTDLWRMAKFTRLRAILSCRAMAFWRSERSREQKCRSSPAAGARRCSWANSAPSPKFFIWRGPSKAWLRPHQVVAVRKDSRGSVPPAIQRKRALLDHHMRRAVDSDSGLLAWASRCATDGRHRIEPTCLLGLLHRRLRFLDGISHAGTLISAILRLTDASWRKPVTRAAKPSPCFA